MDVNHDDDLIVRIRAMGRFVGRPAGNHLRKLRPESYRCLRRALNTDGRGNALSGDESESFEDSSNEAEYGHSNSNDTENSHDVADVRVIGEAVHDYVMTEVTDRAGRPRYL